MNATPDLAVSAIPKSETHQWILRKHYALRLPPISFAFGLFDREILRGVVTYGQPASPSLCKGVCGEMWRDRVVELNRLVVDNTRNGASMLIGHSLRQLPGGLVVVSYADTAQGHVGYVYQATNWLYTGQTKERTDMFSEIGHSRHNCGDPSRRQKRSAKHRYVYFTGTKRERRELLACLNYQVLPYPKGQTRRYDATASVDIQQVFVFDKPTQENPTDA